MGFSVLQEARTSAIPIRKRRFLFIGFRVWGLVITSPFEGGQGDVKPKYTPRAPSRGNLKYSTFSKYIRFVKISCTLNTLYLFTFNFDIK